MRTSDNNCWDCLIFQASGLEGLVDILALKGYPPADEYYSVIAYNSSKDLTPETHYIVDAVNFEVFGIYPSRKEATAEIVSPTKEWDGKEQVVVSGVKWHKYYESKKGVSHTEYVKKQGVSSIAEFSRLSGESTQNLTNWYRNKPQRFDLLLFGALREKFQEEVQKVSMETGSIEGRALSRGVEEAIWQNAWNNTEPKTPKHLDAPTVQTSEAVINSSDLEKLTDQIHKAILRINELEGRLHDFEDQNK